MARRLNCSIVMVLGGLCLLTAGVLDSQAAAPRPNPVPQSWELQVSYKPPQLMSIEGLDGRIRWYWFLTYKVVNNTGQDRQFFPEVYIATDEGDIISADENVPASVFLTVKQRLDNPLLVSSIDVVGKLLQGDDLAKETVAIWPAFEHDVDQMDVFVTGLSGETAAIAGPAGRSVVLRKTLMLTYQTPGTQVHPQDQDIIAVSETWVMR